MAKRTIVWTRAADLQLIGVLEFWLKKNKSTDYSKKLLSLVTEKTMQILNTPLIYKLTDFEDVRVASLQNFSIYYKITDK